jgi:hypothetical protein
LWRLSPTAASGITLFDTGTTTEARYVESATGHIFETNLNTGTSTRLSNTLIPQSYESIWVGTSTVLIRSVNDQNIITTFAGTLSSATSSDTTAEAAGSLLGSYLEPNIAEITAAPDNSGTIFYLVSSENETVGVRSRANGSQRTVLWRSPLSGWNITWPESDTFVLTQSATTNRPGSAYRLDPNGSTAPLITQSPGLAVNVSPNGESVLYSTIQSGLPVLFVQTENGSVPTSLNTFAEKCVWDRVDPVVVYCAVPELITPTGLPDSWYRGEVHFSDRLWKIDIARGASELLIAPSNEYDAELDMINLVINPGGTHISFTDRLTRTPWVFRIQQ